MGSAVVERQQLRTAVAAFAVGANKPLQPVAWTQYWERAAYQAPGFEQFATDGPFEQVGIGDWEKPVCLLAVAVAVVEMPMLKMIPKLTAVANLAAVARYYKRVKEQ